MITKYEKIEEMVFGMLKNSKLFDFFSIQEKNRLVGFFYASLNEFELLKDVNSYKSEALWKNSAKTFLINELDGTQENFGIKELAKKIDLDKFLLDYYRVEFLFE